MITILKHVPYLRVLFLCWHVRISVLSNMFCLIVFFIFFFDLFSICDRRIELSFSRNFGLVLHLYALVSHRCHFV